MQTANVIFDLDGTLIDTRDAATATWREALAEYGLTFSDDELRLVFGMTSQHAFERLGREEPGGFDARWVENYGHNVERQRLFPGALDALEALRARGARLGIVSSRNRQEFADYLGGFGLEELCPTIVLADDTQRHKPDPDPLLAWCERVGAHPGECLYVGDTPGDEQAAAAAGMPFVAAAWDEGAGPFTPGARLFHDPGELVASLGR